MAQWQLDYQQRQIGILPVIESMMGSTSLKGLRIKLSAADVWADPDAPWDACMEVWCAPLEELAPDQRAAALGWRYMGEINNGGHLQYFVNLGSDAEMIVPETIAAWRALGRSDYADVLLEAFRRWTGAARLAPADPIEYAAVAHEKEFDDVDDAFYTLNTDSNGGDVGFELMRRHFHENAYCYVEILPPVSENDRKFIGLGDPSSGPDGGLAIWLKFARNENPRVRLRAAQALVPLDREAAIRTLNELKQDCSVPYFVRIDAASTICDIEPEE